MRRATMVMIGALLLLGAGCSDDDDGDAPDDGGDAVADDGGDGGEPAAGEVVLTADLTGDAEVPGPGDELGSGQVAVRVTPGTDEVCWELTVEDLDEVTAAHIHEGRAEIAGGIAVTLDTPVDGASEGCVEATSSIVDGLAEGTRSFYVNVHTVEFPDGAVRGQIVE